MTAERHWHVKEREITPLLAENQVLTYAKPRRSVGRIVRLYWLQALAFVVFLAVVFLFTAMGHLGN